MSQLLTAEEVAARAQISAKLVYKLVANGELPALRYGRLVRFREQDMEAWEAAQINNNQEEAA